MLLILHLFWRDSKNDKVIYADNENKLGEDGLEQEPLPLSL